MAARIAILLLVLTVTACGFRPLYATATQESVSAHLAGIAVTPLPGRVGRLVENDLESAFVAGGANAAANYALDIALDVRHQPLVIEQDASINRYNVVLIADFALTDTASGEIRHKGVSRVVSAFNVVQSQYATLVARRDAEDRAAEGLAEDIRLQLALYFDRIAQDTK